jgi:prepilin-type N-terminal cleavage/methylation domain-containing protein
MLHGARASRGFTLLELIVVVSLVLVLIGFARLNHSQFSAHHRLNQATRQVQTDLRLARTKAVSQGAAFRVTFDAATSSYAVERQNDDGTWESHALFSKSVSMAAPVPVSVPSPVRLTSDEERVTFEPRGNTAAPVRVTLSHPGIDGATRVVEVSFAGQVAIQ